MPNTNRAQSANAQPALLGALLESKNPVTSWSSWSEDKLNESGNDAKILASAFGRLVYSGMPLYHALALFEQARIQQRTAVETIQMSEAVRKLLLLDIPTSQVCGLVGYLFGRSAIVPVAEAIGVLDTFRKKVMRGAESDDVYLEMTSPPASLVKDD